MNVTAGVAVYNVEPQFFFLETSWNFKEMQPEIGR
jgi:hypothetical protein